MTDSRFDAGMKVRAKVLMHVAVYAGVPAANSAMAIAKRELEKERP